MAAVNQCGAPPRVISPSPPVWSFILQKDYRMKHRLPSFPGASGQATVFPFQTPQKPRLLYFIYFKLTDCSNLYCTYSEYPINKED